MTIDEVIKIDNQIDNELHLDKLDEFYRKAHEFKVRHNITTFTDGGVFRVQSISEIRQFVHELLLELENKTVTSCSSGGFTVSKSIDGKIHLTYGINLSI